MIFLPIISLGFVILFLMGALVSFQYFTHYQSLTMLERTHIVDQRQRAQSALGVLVAFSFAAVVALGGLLLPALMGYTPDPVPPENLTPPLPGTVPTLPTGETSGGPPSPTAPAEPTAALTPTRILTIATIGNTGGAGANIRSIPGLGGNIITVLADGTRVILLEETERVDGFNWQSIEIPNTQKGWVVVQFLIPDS